MEQKKLSGISEELTDSACSDFRSLSQKEEGHYFERKSARKDVNEISKHIIAFANASGGSLVVGIEDDGSVTGFKRAGAHSVEDFEQAHLVGCTPTPKVDISRVPVVNVQNESDTILVIDVEASKNRVVRSARNGSVYLREGDKSVTLSHEQITALEYDKNERSFEDQNVAGATVLDVSSEVMEQYKRKLDTDLDDESVLRNRGFLKHGELTVAGVLLFAENPYIWMPTARVRFVRFDGDKMGTGKSINIIKEKTFEGPIPLVLGEVKDMVNSQLREFQYLSDDGKFITIPEYPEFAWFEGLVNALAHRDYSYSGDCIRVLMYNDRLEILSPGSLPNIVTLENMRETRYSRNPRIARALGEFGWVKELNEGVNRIYSEMQKLFLNDPVYSEPQGRSVLLVLNNSITSRALRGQDSLSAKFGEEVLDSLSEYEIAALRYVLGKKRITTKELAETIDKNNKFASRVLKGLSNKDILRWHGSSDRDPSQHYTF